MKKEKVTDFKNVRHQALPFLHSHSGLERELCFDKAYVLIDPEFKDSFDGVPVEIFETKRRKYLKVPILSFVNRNGVFKNLRE